MNSDSTTQPSPASPASPAAPDTPIRVPTGRRRGPGPFLLLTLFLIALPLSVGAVAYGVLDGARPEACSGFCISDRDGVVFLIMAAGSIAFLPCWFLTSLVLLVMRTSRSVRDWPPILQLASALPMGVFGTWAAWGFWTPG